jgi:basic membrane protein A
MVAVAALALSACGAAPEDTDSSTEDGFLVCMVSDSGGYNDRSFNQSGHEGLVKAVDELKVRQSAVESKDPTDFAPNLEATQASGCGLTITVGFLLSEATKAAAEANPDSDYAIIDDDQIVADNVKPLVFKTSDASFLAGYVAAGYSKTGVVATYGGQEIPSVSIFMDGFVDGVARYNEDNGTSVKVLGWDKKIGTFTGDFQDEAKGKNTTQNFIDQGADVIMPVAGPVGAGTLAAAKEADDVAVIWVDADGFLTNPDYGDIILTSVIKEIGQAVYETIEEASKGSFTNTPYVGTLANGGVSLAPFHDFDSKVSQELKDQVADLEKQIIAGTLKITSDNDPK